MKRKRMTIQELCVVGITAALICVMAPLSIPLPLGVPITLQTFIITLAAIILGSKRGAIATFIYVLLGAFGLPVFSNFTGGWQIIVGPTGGFILSFPIMAYIIGLGFKLRFRLRGSAILSIVLGNVINLLLGTVMFCFVINCSFLSGITACILPFLPITVVKIILSWIIGLKIRARIVD